MLFTISQVSSTPATAAINYWFSTALSWIIPNHPHASPQSHVTAAEPELKSFFPSQLQPTGTKIARPYANPISPPTPRVNVCRYVLYCLLVDACAATAEETCAQMQQHHLGAFQQQHLDIKIQASLACLETFSEMPLCSIVTFATDFCLCLNAAQSLLFLLLIARHTSYSNFLPQLMMSLHDWGAYIISNRLEAYDAVRSQASEDDQAQLPDDGEDYFAEVFKEFDDIRGIKMAMLKKSQAFAKQTSKSMLFGGILCDKYDSSDEDDAGESNGDACWGSNVDGNDTKRSRPSA